MRGSGKKRLHMPQGYLFVVVLIVLLGLVIAILGCSRKEKEKQLQNQYIVRYARYDIIDDHMLAYDQDNPRVVTMDPWFEVIYAAADGQRTVSEFIAQISSEYPDGAPAGLSQQISGFVDKMVTEGLIRLSPVPANLPYYLASPVSEQDPEKAKELMIRDGLIEPDVNESLGKSNKE